MEPPLREEMSHLDDLLQCLSEEHEALLAGDVTALEALTLRKHASAQALETETRRRGSTTPAGREWDELTAKAAHCRERNLANAALLTALQQRTRRGLDYLGAGPALYGRKGHLHEPARGRVLARG